MGSRKAHAYYDDDDLEDYEDDEEFDEDYFDEDGDYDDEPVVVKQTTKNANKPNVSAKGKDASILAQALAAPPLKPKKHEMVSSSAATNPKINASSTSNNKNESKHVVTPFTFDTPSPDDVIIAAQQQQRQQHRTTKGNPSDNNTDAATRAMADVHITDDGSNMTQHHQYKTFNHGASTKIGEYVLEPDLQAECDKAHDADTTPGSKPRLHLVVLGHVDAGKSTLMGRMLYELGLVDEKSVHKIKKDAAAAGKASFAWAWMLDERPEERARGVTVDVGLSRFETSQRIVTLLDAPGHRDFVPNMIAGAAQADAALLVVDGSPGGFEAGFVPAKVGSPEGGGQTREHAQLARSLGVTQAAVVVTKLDTCDFSKERFDYIRSEMEPFLIKTCGFKAEQLQWLPAVGPTGENLVKPPSDPLLSSWYRDGTTLAQAIDAFTPAHRRIDLPLRLPVAEVAVRGNKGVMVSGKMEGGAVQVGTKVLIMPSKETAVVKSVEVDGKPARVARAGDSCDVTISGCEPSAVHIGYVVCHPNYPVPLAVRFEVEVVVLDVQIPILKGQQVTLHTHAARDSGHVSKLVALLDGKTGEVLKERPRCLVKGQSARIEITPARPLPIELYADYKSLGRIALRDGGRTLAVGIVTNIDDNTH